MVALDACAVRTVDTARVAATRQRLIGPDAAADLAAVFRLLGDPKRIRILFALLEAGELCVCDLAAPPCDRGVKNERAGVSAGR